MNPKPRFSPAEVGAAQEQFRRRYPDIASSEKWLARADKTTVALQKQWPTASAAEIIESAAHRARVAKVEANRKHGIAAIIKDRAKYRRSI